MLNSIKNSVVSFWEKTKAFGRSLRTAAGVAVGAATVAVAQAQASPIIATVPTEIDTLLDDAGAVWTTVKALVIGFAAFGLLMFVVFKVRSKKGS